MDVVHQLQDKVSHHFFFSLFKEEGLRSATPSWQIHFTNVGVKVARWVSFTWNEASLDDVFVRPPTIIELGCEGLSCEKEAEREGHGNGCPRAEIKWMSSGKWYMNRVGLGGRGWCTDTFSALGVVHCKNQRLSEVGSGIHMQEREHALSQMRGAKVERKVEKQEKTKNSRRTAKKNEAKSQLLEV